MQSKLDQNTVNKGITGITLHNGLLCIRRYSFTRFGEYLSPFCIRPMVRKSSKKVL